jgi:pimeloyl-ACP methyl ester carboxylesterase
MPIPLMVGEHDEACVPVHALTARTIPNATHHVRTGARHLTNLEAPEAFNVPVAEFLEAHLAKIVPTELFGSR